MTDWQLEKWVNGESVHNDERGECCPDFSCCRPELLAPEQVRKQFLAANIEQRMALLGHFLAAAMNLAASDKDVYIAGAGLVHD